MGGCRVGACTWVGGAGVRGVRAGRARLEDLQGRRDAEVRGGRGSGVCGESWDLVAAGSGEVGRPGLGWGVRVAWTRCGQSGGARAAPPAPVPPGDLSLKEGVRVQGCGRAHLWS